jgi:hypothetical protein
MKASIDPINGACPWKRLGPGGRAKQTQWGAFTARNQLRAPELPVIVQHLQRFLESVIGHRT